MKFLHNRRAWRMVLVTTLIPLAFLAFWPTPVDQPVQGQLAGIFSFLHHRGIPVWLNYRFVEASANVALFIPFGIISSLSFPEKRWWYIGFLGLLISCCMELGQFLILHNRFSSPLDLVTNTSGAVIGAMLAAATLKKRQVRRLSAADPVIRH